MLCSLMTPGVSNQNETGVSVTEAWEVVPWCRQSPSSRVTRFLGKGLSAGSALFPKQN